MSQQATNSAQNARGFVTLDDVPNTGNQYPKRLSLALSSEMSEKLDRLEKEKGKSKGALLRLLIEDFFRRNPL